MAEAFEYISSSNSEEEEEDCVVVGNYQVPTTILENVLHRIREEKLIVNATKGPQVIAITEALLRGLKSAEVSNFNSSMVEQIQACLKANKNGRVVLSKMWRGFHLLRLSTATLSLWENCIRICHLAEDVVSASGMTLQIVLKRMMQNVIKQLTKSSVSTTPSHHIGLELSMKDLDVIRYVAGYVILKMKKKFSNQASFINALLDTTHEYCNVDTIQDYSRVWVEQVDRGGLYHVNSDFFETLKSIECVCRRHLDVRDPPTENVSEEIISDALSSSDVISSWKKLTDGHFVILKGIIKLWCTIRIHSFTKRWSDFLMSESTKTNHVKAIRKTLKKKGTEKDTSY